MEHDTTEERDMDLLPDEPAGKPAKKRPSKPKEKASPKAAVLCAGCGEETDRGRYCWDCRDVAKDLSVRLVVESFAQGHEVTPGVRLAFDWTDAALAERGRRVRADADMRGGA